MGLTTERKVFFSVLFIAGAALVIDRGVLGPSDASASADSLIPSDAFATEPVHASPTAASSTPSAQTMAQVLMDRLGSIQGDESEHSLSSAFSLEQLVNDPGAIADGDAGSIPAEPTLPQLIPSETELPDLSSVMPSATSGGGAVLNGELWRVGDVSPEGLKLIEVRERSVVLMREGRTYIVELPMQNQP
jgi:hypothetical protein